MAGSSAAYFVNKLLAKTAGLKSSDYSIVSGTSCMKTPCAAGTLPAMLKNKQIDAFGIWEPAVELAIRALGEKNVVVFQNASIYREIYSLYSRADKLNSPTVRKDIVAFVRALNQTLDTFTNSPEKVYQTVASAVGMDVDVLKSVWKYHKWSGQWGDDLLDFLVEEDQWLAGQDRRQATKKADLAMFLDATVIAEV